MWPPSVSAKSPTQSSSKIDIRKPDLSKARDYTGTAEPSQNKSQIAFQMKRPNRRLTQNMCRFLARIQLEFSTLEMELPKNRPATSETTQQISLPPAKIRAIPVAEETWIVAFID